MELTRNRRLFYFSKWRQAERRQWRKQRSEDRVA
nr:MAG TPA: Microtubule end binding protein end binding protein complex.3A [Caudoviricetes sp.]